MTTEKGPTQADMESARLTYEMCESASFALGLSGVAPTPENVQAVQIRRIAIALAAAREQGRAEERDADKPLLRMLKEARDMNGIVDCTDAQGTMKVRRVLGTLPVTADGVVAMPGTEVFHPDQDTYFHLEVMRIDWDWKDDEFPLPENCEYVAHYSYYEHDTGFSTRETYDVGACYSTREAALAARGVSDEEVRAATKETP